MTVSGQLNERRNSLPFIEVLALLSVRMHVFSVRPLPGEYGPN